MAPRSIAVRLENQGDIVLEDYYNTVALAPGQFQFLSPVNLELWRRDLVQWAIGGIRIGEIGPGEGQLAIEITKAISKPTYFLFIDISAIMLDIVRQKVGAISNKLVNAEYIQASIEEPPPARAALDRLFAINLFQDVDPIVALQNFRRLLKIGGQLRLTILAKEAEDQFAKDSPCYDVDAGIWYSLSPFHSEKGSLAMGFIEIDGSEYPFYRIQRFYTKSQICNFLGETGFSVRKIAPIIYPIKHVLARWQSHNHYTEISDEQWKLLNTWGGYMDGWDVEAYAV